MDLTSKNEFILEYFDTLLKLVVQSFEISKRQLFLIVLRYVVLNFLFCHQIRVVWNISTGVSLLYVDDSTLFKLICRLSQSYTSDLDELKELIDGYPGEVIQQRREQLLHHNEYEPHN